jgi:hypothetical protein
MFIILFLFICPLIEFIYNNYFTILLKISGCKILLIKKSRRIYVNWLNKKCIFLLNDIILNNNNYLEIDKFLTKESSISCDNLLVYPSNTSLNTYTKMAWEEQMPIQIIVTRNKDKIFSFFNKLYYYRSEIINHEYFSSFEEFDCYVSLIWEDSFKLVFEKEERELEKESTIVPINI